MPSLQRFLSGSNAANAARAAAQALVADMAELPQHVALAAPKAPLDFRQELRFDDVSYVYAGTAERVIDHLDLVVRRGESVGLVGPSGAGKTTLVDLVLGLLRPTSGRILVDGEVLEGDMIGAWRAAVGYVPQDVFLFDDSVRRNIAIGVPDAEIDPDRVARAVALAQFSEVMAELPEGLDTNMGERGVRLSGGQRQRLGIARALYGAPRILVLDEATSSLDGITEAAFTETVESLRGEMTLVVIAHRLSTVRRCDRIVLLTHGTVEASGSFDELVEQSDHFASLVQHAGLSVARPGSRRRTLTAPADPGGGERATLRRCEAPTSGAGVPVRSLAFYLPQFHPHPENDAWWGEGLHRMGQRAPRPAPVSRAITSLTSRPGGLLRPARPIGPARQAEQARRYGLSGFVYFHYWFTGKRLLERPFTEVLKTGEPDFGFALCWANEDWTRTWTGAKELLVAHTSSPDGRPTARPEPPGSLRRPPGGEGRRPGAVPDPPRSRPCPTSAAPSRRCGTRRPRPVFPGSTCAGWRATRRDGRPGRAGLRRRRRVPSGGGILPPEEPGLAGDASADRAAGTVRTAIHLYDEVVRPGRCPQPAPTTSAIPASCHRGTTHPGEIGQPGAPRRNTGGLRSLVGGGAAPVQSLQPGREPRLRPGVERVGRGQPRRAGRTLGHRPGWRLTPPRWSGPVGRRGDGRRRRAGPARGGAHRRPADGAAVIRRVVLEEPLVSRVTVVSQAGPPVVDDELLAAATGVGVVLEEIRLDTRIGACSGPARGDRHVAGDDFVATLDDDIVVERGTLSDLVVLCQERGLGGRAG